jgi:hypothetical protein
VNSTMEPEPEDEEQAAAATAQPASRLHTVGNLSGTPTALRVVSCRVSGATERVPEVGPDGDEVATGGKPVCVYLIECTGDDGGGGCSWDVERRFSRFDQLNAALVTHDLRGLKGLAFPSKINLWKSKKAVESERVVSLNAWMQAVLAVVNTSDNKRALVEWLQFLQPKCTAAGRVPEPEPQPQPAVPPSSAIPAQLAEAELWRAGASIGDLGPEPFWARAGEGCDGAALAAVRRAVCEARPTEAGGDCELGLYHKNVGESGAAALGRALESLPRPLPYTTIGLQSNRLGPAGVRSVARGLRIGYGGGGGGGRGLERLVLTSDPFGGDAEAVGALAAALPPTLKGLSLTSVGLGDAGLGALLPSLRALPALEGLGLGDNELGAEGFGALGAALPSWGALRALFLQGNSGAGSAGVRALAVALPGAPPSLATLHVRDCGAGAAAVAELERAGARIGALKA